MNATRQPRFTTGPKPEGEVISSDTQYMIPRLYGEPYQQVTNYLIDAGDILWIAYGRLDGTFYNFKVNSPNPPLEVWKDVERMLGCSWSNTRWASSGRENKTTLSLQEQEQIDTFAFRCALTCLISGGFTLQDALDPKNDNKLLAAAPGISRKSLRVLREGAIAQGLGVATPELTLADVMTRTGVESIKKLFSLIRTGQEFERRREVKNARNRRIYAANKP